MKHKTAVYTSLFISRVTFKCFQTDNGGLHYHPNSIIMDKKRFHMDDFMKH